MNTRCGSGRSRLEVHRCGGASARTFYGKETGICWRPGLTQLEVLVVISILAVIAAISIPAVQRSRESARRIQCMSRLKSVISAVQAYEAARGEYPGEFLHKSLLPYLGLPEEAKSATVYICPADPESIGEWANNRQSYYPNKGQYISKGKGFSPAGDDRANKLRDMRDGLSQTAAIAERLAWPHIHGNMVNWDYYPQWWIRRLRDTQVHHSTVAEFADECEHRALRPLTTWARNSGYNHILPPNRNSCINETISDLLIAATSTSLHAGGVNVALLDGSCRFMSDNISRDVWWALGSRDGKELVEINFGE